MMQSKNLQQGFTLIEMLVALALGALMMTGIAASFSAMTQTQSLTRDYEQIQETLRFTTSLISRSLRTAEELVNEPDDNAPTDANQFSVRRVGDDERRSCNGQTPDAEFYETYYQPAGTNQLACRVSRVEGTQQSWEGEEVIAYGISSFNLTCLAYSHEDEQRNTDYDACSDVDPAQVIAVKFMLTFDSSEFRRLESYPEHRFIATLRSRLRECANNGC
ncbi:prepilin-type N-terminal cleavage/methylation domain-containing protein [Marinospirillum celere]|uniref:Prepilin-type N-terminal cleavage/methylation domain-containing protein n=1 Tax=Marinospirillum celere TaxID=1122252 RepID=A0A1I1IUQ2_9GAMM|nr:prepilin-type N-terminal cleavage/methylation domain-containing protein [Marinospirillum celere]SFC37463.1 prepilin-type N-terminal cleavage/methylation domain-containing protein [Marinospirillum celere]